MNILAMPVVIIADKYKINIPPKNNANPFAWCKNISISFMLY